VRITFVPDLAEHLRARRELGRVARIFDPRGMLPQFLAIVLLSKVIVQAANVDGPWWSVPAETFGFMAMFFMGVGLQAGRDAGKPVIFELGAEGIEVVQPRHHWRVAWSDVRRVEETPEFFVVAAARTAFYLPRRALGGAEGEAALRRILHARGG
jgi:hypothetical protein